MKHALVVLAALILGMSTSAYADPDPGLSGPLRSLLRASAVVEHATAVDGGLMRHGHSGEFLDL
jgi:hypothetical protein